MAKFLEWVRNHDESWLFVAMYIGFAVVLSVWLSLFWLVLMVGVHLLFEIVRQYRAHQRWPAILSMASWEVRVDVALVLLAFAVSLYLEVITGGILGVQYAGRAAAAGTRAVVWQRAVRAVVLGFDDVANAIRAVLMKKSTTPEEAPAAEGAGEAGPAPVATAAEAVPHDAGSEAAALPPVRFPGWSHPWSIWDRLTMGLCGACVAAMIVAPPLTDSTYGDALETLREELRPFPEGQETAVDGSSSEEGWLEVSDS